MEELAKALNAHAAEIKRGEDLRAAKLLTGLRILVRALKGEWRPQGWKKQGPNSLEMLSRALFELHKGMPRRPQVTSGELVWPFGKEKDLHEETLKASKARLLRRKDLCPKTIAALEAFFEEKLGHKLRGSRRGGGGLAARDNRPGSTREPEERDADGD